jgi:hypothetical protein
MGNFMLETDLSRQHSSRCFPPLFLIIAPHVILGMTRRRWAHLGLTIYSLGSVTYALFDVAVALTEMG